MPHPYPRPPRYALRVRRSTSGLGLFADEPIPKDRFVIEYWGEVVPNEISDNVGGRYLFDLDNGYTILGATRKNIARYANHSCDPNCETRIDGNRVFLFSIRPITSGEPITYDYGKEYFDEFIKPHGCKCASCR